MAKKLDQLLAQRAALDLQIKATQKAELAAKRERAYKALESAGVFDMPENDLIAALAKIKPTVKHVSATQE
ncbi:MAG: hypothetical protein Q7K57_44190 [Burkholderiaceae bacterium]|nr:hypothetical protein [Burkholderiaceae bacterium]